MTDMPNAAHAKPGRRDHLLWFVGVIAAFALYDVWGSWTEVGDKSGFTHGTGWTLTVVVEAFAVCALIAWLADAPGPRSRRFAKWSALIVFTLSLAGQSAAHLTARMEIPPAAVVVFVSVLPVIMLALGAVLIHLRIADRAEVQEVAQESALAVELAVLRDSLEDMQGAFAEAQDEHETTRGELAEALKRAETAERKLAAAAPRKRTPQKPAKKPAAAPRSKPAGDPATEVPNDVDAQAEALAILAAEPGISGAKLAERVGMSERWGQTFKKNLSGSTAGPDAGNQETP